MDIGNLSSEAAAILAPFLPMLISQGKLITGKALEELGKQVGSSSWSAARRLWELVHPKLDTAESRDALQSIAEDPDETQRSESLKTFLTNTMTRNPESVTIFAKGVQVISNSQNITMNVS